MTIVVLNNDYYYVRVWTKDVKEILKNSVPTKYDNPIVSGGGAEDPTEPDKKIMDMKSFTWTYTIIGKIDIDSKWVNNTTSGSSLSDAKEVKDNLKKIAYTGGVVNLYYEMTEVTGIITDLQIAEISRDSSGPALNDYPTEYDVKIVFMKASNMND